jgi:uncharacterized membrane protein HdeD (DUF308 family)
MEGFAVLKVMTRYWWAVALRGTLAVLFGMMALAWPGITVFVLVALFGAYALVDGAIAVAQAIGGKLVVGRGWLVLEGIAGVLAGIVTFVWPGITALVLLVVIAAWALVTGVFEIVAAVWLRREIKGEWLLALSGALSVLFAVLLVINPGAGAIAVVWVIGAYAIVFGVALVALGLRLRQLGRTDGALPGTTLRPTPNGRPS